MFREMFLWIVLLIFNIINTILLLLSGKLLFNVPLWVAWSLWGTVTLIIIGLVVFRKIMQSRYSSLNSSLRLSIKLNENEYFFQTPLYTVDKQTIPIYGENNMTYTTVFFNNFHKLISIFGFQPIYSIFLNSENINVKVIPKKILEIRPKYNVYMNDKQIGTFEMKRFLDSGGKQQLPYQMNYGSEQLLMKSSYFSKKTTILNSRNEVLLVANRSLFDFSKNQTTKKRGEQHHLHLICGNVKKEILIAIYIQAIINKRTQ
ncbi:hypothetical protein NKW85_07585 [Staphylococcus simulans]|nr:hypothetical protein [Staphylococcus simulans]MCE5149212.1 hypothetical protein [Staphylococcus simulans]PTJ33915.1 hypothetical protein BU026_03720 [Staphylococcus simulans]